MTAGYFISEESPGSIGQRQLLTATGGDPRESATETIPPPSGGKGERSARESGDDVVATVKAACVFGIG